MIDNTLVLGLGNPILSDDGVGIFVVREVQKLVPEAHISETVASGFRVVDEMVGFQRLILVDSIITGKAPPGTIHRLTREQLEGTLHYNNPHDVGLFEAIKIMESHNQPLPEEMIFLAIEILDCDTFSEECTPLVKAAITKAVEAVLELLQ
ncbi:MAG: hydrogenase maturation protease [Candidatus Cloacimonetes bacterium]|nr:hydrogenase maturation protease [Candidatus Cloacimonadota bacterium]